MFELNGKVAVVTGAGRGIGQAISLALAKLGAVVVATDVSDEAVAATPAAILAAGGQSEGLVMNVAEPASVDAAVAATLNRRGRIDILINNAGITRDQFLMRLKREEWDLVLQVNLTGAFVCTQAVLRPMMKQRSGRIISISSVVGQLGNPGQSNYAASKAGLIGFSKSVAREVASRNITVNVVAPGLIDTDMTRGLREEMKNEWLSKVPLNRPGSVDDVASAVCFLATDEAAYITGQVLAVNGGMYM